MRPGETWTYPGRMSEQNSPDDLTTAQPPAASPDVPAAAGSSGHPFLVYTAARILVFLAAAGVLYLFGARGFLLLVLAVLVSGLISFIVLNRLRDQVSERVAARMDASRERRERAAAAEDDVF